MELFEQPFTLALADALGFLRELHESPGARADTEDPLHLYLQLADAFDGVLGFLRDLFR